VTHTCRDLGNSEAIDTYFGFDDNGNQLTLTDDSSHTTTWNYNSRDLVTSITYHDDASRTFTWSTDDTLSGWTDENGTEVTNTFDDDGRLTARAIDRAPGVLGPTEEAYSYDGLGRLTQGTNDNSTVQRTYDTFSRLLSETQGPNPLGQNGKTISYTYDDGGNRATCEYFSGYDLVYTPDALGRWQKVEDAQSDDLVSWQFYGPGGRTKRAVHLNGTSENLGYDGYRFVTDVDHKDSVDATFAGFDYGYDAMGNPLYEERTHQSGAGDCYAYDKAYRLTAALIGSSDPSAECADSDWDDYAHAKLTEYQLDDVSNRTSVDTTPYQGQTSYASYTTNSVNEYTVVDTVNRTHDANGNLTSAGSTTMAYDYRNNLIEVRQNQFTIAQFEYDVFDRRTKSTAGATVRRYCSDGLDPIEVFDGNGGFMGGYVLGGDPAGDAGVDGPAGPQPSAFFGPDRADVDEDEDFTETVVFALCHDSRGSVVCAVGPGGVVAEQYTYGPHGETTVKDGQGNDLFGISAIGNTAVFRGLQRDETTGLYFTSAGVYDPVVGRQLQTRGAGTSTVEVTTPQAFCGVGPLAQVNSQPRGFYEGFKPDTPDYPESVTWGQPYRPFNRGWDGWTLYWSWTIVGPPMLYSEKYRIRPCDQRLGNTAFLPGASPRQSSSELIPHEVYKQWDANVEHHQIWMRKTAAGVKYIEKIMEGVATISEYVGLFYLTVEMNGEFTAYELGQSGVWDQIHNSQMQAGMRHKVAAMAQGDPNNETGLNRDKGSEDAERIRSDKIAQSTTLTEKTGPSPEGTVRIEKWIVKVEKWRDSQ
jgi:YD repeat-containing protein